jgi:hypothetical protein
VRNVSILDPKSKNGLEDSDVLELQKYLINENGELEK